MRMKPASTTRSGAWVSMTAARAVSKASRSEYWRWSTTAVAMPWEAAKARPAASGRLAITAATRAGQPSLAQARTMASILEPRPEIRMTMFSSRNSTKAAPHPAANRAQNPPDYGSVGT